MDVKEGIAKVLELTSGVLVFLLVSCYILGTVLKFDYVIPGKNFMYITISLLVLYAIAYVVLKYVYNNEPALYRLTGFSIYLVLVWALLVVRMLICKIPFVQKLAPKSFYPALGYLIAIIGLNYGAKLIRQ